jgi:uroporphyrinogen decarboxylase
MRARRSDDMTSKERVLTALEHREPDRIPYDFGATIDTGIHHICYRNLLQHMGKEYLIREEKQTKFMDLATGIVQIDKETVEESRTDARGIVPSLSGDWSQEVRKEGGYEVITDGLGAKWFRPPGGYYFDQREGSYPLAGITSAAEIEEYNWPHLADSERIRGLREKIRALGEDYAIAIGSPVGGVFALGFRMRGYENFYLDLAANPSLACTLLDKLTDLTIQYWDKVLNEVGDLVNVIVYEDDLGEQERALISPKMYRELVKPRHKRIFSFLRQKKSASTYTLMHSDGSIYDLIPDLIEIGVDILNPIQVSAANMDPKRLKREFGDDIVFWGGGINTQGVFSFGTPDEVRDEVKRRIEDFAPGGGFVFSTVHNIQPEVPPANIMAMWETLQDYGEY